MRLLIADDDEITLELMVEAFRPHPGYEIETASDGESALERVATGEIDFVISDWMMPRMTGVELCRRIRAADLPQYVYFMLVTSREDVEDAVEGLASGADEFIRKPVDPIELGARVRSLERLKRLNDTIKTKNEELERSQELRDDWLNMIVHDVRSPMSAILGFSDLLLKAVGSEHRRRLEIVRREALRVDSMLEQMLIMGKSESGRLKLVKSPVDLLPIVRKAQESAMAVASAGRVSIHVSPDEGRFSTQLDPSLINRVVDNLITNAVRFSPPDSTIEIELQNQVDDLVLSVADLGPGVPAEARDSVFEKYRTLDDKGRSRHGLGLTFCRLVAEAHGGEISCKENRPRGARFEIRIPVIHAPRQSDCAETTATPNEVVRY